MLMPETAINKDHFFHTRKYEIGLSRQIAAVQAVPVPHAVD